MEKEQRLFKVIFWDKNDDTKPGQRTTVFAPDPLTAQQQVKELYGENLIISLYNEEDANRIRSL